MKNKSLLALAAALAAGAALGDYKVDMNRIDIKGVGESLGTVVIASTPGGGLTFTPDLKGLPPGAHGFHVHQFANCAAKQKDGKLEPGEAAGEHYDPGKTHKHAGPAGEGHKGDLPVLNVGANGEAKEPLAAPRLALKDMRGKSLIIHQGGDTYSEPPPNGGGGARIACGVVEPISKKK